MYITHDINSEHITNICEGAAHAALIKASADEVARLLARHCGPYAEYAISVGSLGPGSDGAVDEYTKDGISIANLLATDSWGVQFLLRSVRYIGERVDRVCHDGTTTSMLFTAALISNLWEAFEKRPDLNKNKPLVAKAITWVIDELRACIDDSKITVEETIKLAKIRNPTTAHKLKQALCYRQAMISTKGDRELSNAVALVMGSIPQELYGLYTFKQASVEMDERVRVDVQEHDVEFMSNLLFRDMYNAALRTELRLTGAHAIYSHNAIINACPEEQALLALLTPDSEDRPMYGLEQESPEDTKYITAPLALITGGIQSTALSVAIRNWNTRHPDKMVYPLSMQVPVLLMPMYASGLAAISDRKSLADAITSIDTAIIEPRLNIHQYASTVRISNCYTKVEGAFHPSYVNPKRNDYYTTIVSELKALLDRSRIKHINNRVETAKEDIILLYRMMVSQKIVDVRVCGLTHDLLANITVVDDAAGAVTSLLGGGFVLSGYSRMAVRLEQLHDELNEDQWNVDYFKSDVVGAFYRAVKQVLQATYRTTRPELIGLVGLDGPSSIGKYESVVIDTDFVPTFTVGEDDYADETRRVKRAVLTKETLRDLAKDPESHMLLIQPISGYYEQLRRLGELLPKMAMSAVLIDTTVPAAG